MGLREDLIAAKALIDTPEKWEGDSLQNAVLQAIDLNANRWLAARQALLESLPHHKSIVAFNYDAATTHADVMALLDRAIAKAGASHV